MNIPNESGKLFSTEARSAVGLGGSSRVIDDLGKDPWHVAEALIHSQQRAFLWFDGETGKSFAALGCLNRSEQLAEDPPIFRQMNDSNIREQAASLPIFPATCMILGDRHRCLPAFAGIESARGPACWLPEIWIEAVPAGIAIWHGWGEQALAETIVQIRARLARPQAVSIPRPARWHEVETDDFAVWESRLREIQTSIRSGDIAKAVLSRRLQFNAETPFAISAILRRLRAQAASRIVFAVKPEFGNWFLGSTPETLVRIETGMLQTHALAGTLPKGATKQAFLSSAKLLSEHRIVVDGLCQSLGEFVETTSIGEVQALEAGTVSHLQTAISARLGTNVNRMRLVAALHPTAAISGFPKLAARQTLDVVEPYDRGWFAAPVGWLAANGDMHTCVAIRSLWLSKTRAAALAGAGIVAGSDARTEWRETEYKFDNMRAALWSES